MKKNFTINNDINVEFMLLFRCNSIYELIYNKNIEGLEEIAQKIIKENGFTKGCK